MGQDALSANSTDIEYGWILTLLPRIVGITRSALKGETGPDGQNIIGHTDVLINDKYVCERQYFKNTGLSFDMGPVSP